MRPAGRVPSTPTPAGLREDSLWRPAGAFLLGEDESQVRVAEAPSPRELHSSAQTLSVCTPARGSGP